MRVALVTARFRARAPFDLGSQVRSLAPALARAGASVEVFCGTGEEAGLAPFAQRRAEVIDHVGGQATFGVTTVALPSAEAEPADLEERLAEGFGAFLDRERPQVVHFERLDVFGTDLVREARARGIRTVYCAADTWPAHDRASLLLPDLEPFELGDGEAEARALLVEEEFGAGPLDTQSMETAAARRVRHLLGEPLTDLDDVARLREASEAVEQRRATKRIALSAVDRRFATTRLLAKNLSASVGRAFTFRAAGVDTSLFQAPDAPRDAAEEPRVVAMGDTSLEGGIDVLLDALAALGDEITPLRPLLVLECSDAQRDADVARRAQELEVETRWTRGPADVHGAIGSADLVLVTQRWGEVMPTACQVALAAGVPVVAARTPGVTEGVPPTAGQLVSPSDAEALAEALRSLLGEEGTLRALTSGAFEASRSTKSVDDEAREWLDTYGQLVAEAKSAAAGRGTGAIADLSARLDELRSLSHAELFGLAQTGIGRLRRAFGLEDDDASLLERAVARGGQGRDRAMAEARTLKELEVALGELRAAREGMRLEEAARERRVADLHGILGQYEAEVFAKRDALEEVDGKVEEAAQRAAEATAAAEELEQRLAEAEADGAAREELLAERDRALEESAARAEELERAGAEALTASEAATAAADERADALGEDLDAVRRDLDEARRAIDAAEEERAQLARTLDERDGLVRAMRERIGAADPEETTGELGSELASIEAFCAALERDAAELRRHDAWMGEQATRLRAALGLEGAAPDGRHPLEEGVARASDALRSMTAELEWRRAEMAAARAAGGALRAKLLAGPLARRVAGWDRGADSSWAPVPLDRAAEGSSEDAGAGAAETAEETPDDSVVVAAPRPVEPPAPLPSSSEETNKVRP